MQCTQKLCVQHKMHHQFSLIPIMVKECFFTQRQFSSLKEINNNNRKKNHCHFVDWTQLNLKIIIILFLKFYNDSFFIYLLHGKV